jgi:hypothetical protein
MDQAKNPECSKWSSFLSVSKSFTPGNYAGQSSPPVNLFLRDVVPDLYQATLPSFATADVYRTAEASGWVTVPNNQSKSGALIIWPGQAGIILSDESDLANRGRNPLQGLKVLYPSSLVGGRLAIADAATLDAALKSNRPPKILLPVPEKGLYWNTWVEREAPRGEQVSNNMLSQDETYTIALDLSRLDYGAPKGNDVGRANQAGETYVREMLARYNEVRVLATPVGLGLVLLDGVIPHRRLLRRETLERSPSPEQNAALGLGALSNVASGFSAVDNFDRSAVRVKVQAQMAGCAGIAFSIWNSRMTRLIDYVVRQVAVVGSNGAVPPCPPSTRIATGVDSPRLSVLSLESSREVSATLHVFERPGPLPSQSYTVVVYSDESLTEPYSWSISDPLSKLEERLHTYIDLHANSNYSNVYLREIGRMIEEHLFTSKDPPANDQPDDATKALSALRRLSQGSGDIRRALFARFVNGRNQPAFVPIHLLGASTDQSDPIASHIDVIHPLPPVLQTGAVTRQCIDSWSLVMPTEILTSTRPMIMPKELDELRDKAGFVVIGEWSPFINYLKGSPAVPGPEGMLLMAHHGEDSIVFSETQAAAPATSNTIRRPFRPGSLAVLAACGVADISGVSKGRGILTRLNELGVGAAVVSPFPVPPEVAAQFTMAFAKAAAEAKKKGEPAEVGKLFEDARSKILQKDSGLNDLSRLRVYELMLVGNGALRLCGKED